MSSHQLDQIVNAVLYEGYILYPYRSSSQKNRRERFTFGRVYPKDYADAQRGAEPCLSQTECLLQASGGTSSLEVTVRFLQPMWREVGGMNASKDGLVSVMPELMVNGVLHRTWQEAIERSVAVTLNPPDCKSVGRTESSFSFPSSYVLEALPGESGTAHAGLLRRSEFVEGLVELESAALGENVFKITVRILNRTPLTPSQCSDQDAVMLRTFASTHTILRATAGEFISLLDPPAAFAAQAAACKNIGTWPVLVGDENKAERDILLSSPIILYDYPQIAPESAGSFFDGTEMDEMLTLRVLTMTDSEKLEMRQVDECARRILERTESLEGEELLRMHGIMREVKTAEDFWNPSKPLQTISADGREFRLGGRVRVHPKKRADAIDMMLDGKIAIVEAIEQDAEGLIHLALVMEDDPGKDLGLARQPGHRFFYSPEEAEPLQEAPV